MKRLFIYVEVQLVRSSGPLVIGWGAVVFWSCRGGGVGTPPRPSNFSKSSTLFTLTSTIMMTSYILDQAFNCPQ